MATIVRSVDENHARDFSAYRLEHDESVKPVRDETERLKYGFAR